MGAGPCMHTSLISGCLVGQQCGCIKTTMAIMGEAVMKVMASRETVEAGMEMATLITETKGKMAASSRAATNLKAPSTTARRNTFSASSTEDLASNHVA